MASVVEVRRGGAVESAHAVHVAAWRGDGLVATSGDSETLTFYRSASKPFQALPLVEDGVVDALGISDDELALCCASHNSEPAHVAGSHSILRKAGRSVDDLECGGHWPLREAEGARLAQEGRVPGSVDSNCSGKHAGMVALAVHHGWPVEGYVQPEHPVQLRMVREICRWTELDESELVFGVDGCGVVCTAVPLSAMARSFARFASAAAAGGAPRRVWDAMVTHPFMVAGTGRACTTIMKFGDGLIAKLGAEGVYVLAHLQTGTGVALKVADGARRAVEPAAVAVAETLGFLSPSDTEALSHQRRPVVTNTRGEIVGEIVPRMELQFV